MTTEKIAGKKLATADRSLLKKLANQHFIRGTRIFPFPTRYEMIGKEPVQVDENAVARLVGRGWIAPQEKDLAGKVLTFEITDKGRDVLAMGVVEEPLDQGRLL